MNRRWSELDAIEIEAPGPSEAWLFAQAILGRPISLSAAESRKRVERESLEWLAGISDRHAEQLRDIERQETAERSEREELEWLASISERHEEELRRVLLSEAQAAETRERYERLCQDLDLQEDQWDPAKHPRRGGPPNAGWFATTGGGGGSSGGAFARAGRTTSTPEPERVLTQIRRSSGNQWSGDRVLDVVGGLVPGWLGFVKKHVTLSLTSNGAREPATTIRRGEFGAAVTSLPNQPLRDQGPLTVHFEIPSDWNDIQVAQYMLTQFADEIDVHRLATDWAAGKPDLFGEIKDQRLRNGLPTIAALAGSYYTTIAALAPGGQAAVVAWDIQEGDLLAAALDVAFLLPLGKIAKSGLEAGGNIAIKAGDKLIGVLPAAAIEQVGKLAPAQQALLHKRLLAAQSAEEAAEIVGKFLATPFDKHHPLPMFLGGHTEQVLSKIPRSIHQEFHAALREELRAAGLIQRIGGPGGSAPDWRRYLGEDSTRQGKAFDAVLRASRAMDAKHGRDITQWVWKNLVGENFFVITSKS